MVEPVGRKVAERPTRSLPTGAGDAAGLAVIETPARRVELAAAIARKLEEVRSIAVATHVGGDGDGWGSACAIAHHFGPRGTRVALLAASAFPNRFRFLLPNGLEPLNPDEDGFQALRSAEVQLVVDVAEQGRLGGFIQYYDPRRTLVIDHHSVSSSPLAAALSLIDPRAASTTELVFDVFAQGALPLSETTARALYVGLVTDTGSFRYSNTTPYAHRVAAALIEAGADPEALFRPLFASQTLSEIETIRAALAALQVDPELGLTWAVLERTTLRRLGALEEYEGVIDHLRNLEGTEIALLFRELEGGTVKVSLRSSGAVNVAAIAHAIGGGGHEKAAGATISAPLNDVIYRVLAACRAVLRDLKASRA